jgi:ParB-like chromosome segregation protein Spo0J
MEETILDIVYLTPEEIIPYANNPRNNEDAVEKVANSIKEFGFKVPIILDENNVIVTGHTRFKASQLLGLKEIPCIKATDLTPKQIKAFRVADNKVAEFSMWDFELLDNELLDLQDFNMEEFGFDLTVDDVFEGGSSEEEEKYSKDIKVPQYEITGEKPAIEDLLKIDKAKGLIEEIENADISEEEKNFLKAAATRHFVFNFRNVAEYYAHANPTIQDLMEKSALVIIDYSDSIRYGYTQLNNELLEMMEEDSQYGTEE